MSEEGLEPPTFWFVAKCSNPLSYSPLAELKNLLVQPNSF